jgi:hypothetical protein
METCNAHTKAPPPGRKITTVLTAVFLATLSAGCPAQTTAPPPGTSAPSTAAGYQKPGEGFGLQMSPDRRSITVTDTYGTRSYISDPCPPGQHLVQVGGGMLACR